MISAKIILDSISREGKRLITWELTYPRFIHAEFMTHRVLSKNAASSRAIPVLKLLKRMFQETAAPIHWGKNQSGMQANEQLEGWRLNAAKALWYGTGYMVGGLAYLGYKIGMHKQTVNRMIEPWSHITVIASGTEWNNFFALRAHKDAQPEFQALARAMQRAMDNSVPKLLEPGEWHLPFVGHVSDKDPNLEDWKAVSVACCAKVSYLNHDGTKVTPEEGRKMIARLKPEGGPMHASPFEHQATPDTQHGRNLDQIDDDFYVRTWTWDWDNVDLHGNFVGWIQNRKTMQGECVR